MDDESLTVEDSEIVYRRIHTSFVDVDAPIPISPAAFRPNPNDTTGLSVFRARFLSAADTLATVAALKRREYYIAGISAGDLLRLGLTIIPEPVAGGPRGHAVIPELSWAAYQADKKRLKEVQLELATIASKNIVHRPS